MSANKLISFVKRDKIRLDDALRMIDDKYGANSHESMTSIAKSKIPEHLANKMIEKSEEAYQSQGGFLDDFSAAHRRAAALAFNDSLPSHLHDKMRNGNRILQKAMMKADDYREREHENN